METFENRGSISEDGKILPLQDNIVLEMLSTLERTINGIIVPNADTIDRKADVNNGKPLYGRVVAVGPGKYTKKGVLVKPDIEIGEIVFINEWGGTSVTVGDNRYTVIRENEALFVTDEVPK